MPKVTQTVGIHGTSAMVFFFKQHFNEGQGQGIATGRGLITGSVTTEENKHLGASVSKQAITF